jgi:hypothetical protein
MNPCLQRSLLAYVGLATFAFPSGVFADALLRGPYLQSCSSTSVVVCWRTDEPTDSRLRCHPTNSFSEIEFYDSAITDEHKVELTGLTPETTYSYSIHSPSRTLAAGPELYFQTHPTNSRPVRVWAIGDAGSGTANQTAVRDAYLNSPNSARTDVWLMLGDNVYPEGSDQDYQLYMFDIYRDMFGHTVFWPAIGNHDAASGSPTTYLNTFAGPAKGEAGGIPSDTRLYYSFDYGKVHFVCLDSWISERWANSAMLNWLRVDLASTSNDWIIAYWHHPPYSMGTDFSDSTPILIEMREQVVPILESYGVDLVLCGHSHVYERSFLLNGHYGTSWTFSSAHALDARLGREDEGSPYRKPAGRRGANQGTVYVVCGNSGQGGPVRFERHPAMAVKSDGYGSVVLDINGLRLDAKYLRSDGTIGDYFTIDKSAPSSLQPRLNITRANNSAMISWSTLSREFILEWSSTLLGTNWREVIDLRTTTAASNFVNIAPTNSGSFFRLRPAP